MARGTGRWGLGGDVLRLEVQNVDAVVANFAGFLGDFRQRARGLADYYGHLAYDTCAARVPVLSGRMLRLLTLRFSPQGFGFTLGWNAIDFAAEGEDFYPPMVEFGTINMAAQPSLYPAIDEVFPLYENALSELLSDIARARSGRTEQGAF